MKIIVHTIYESDDPEWFDWYFSRSFPHPADQAIKKIKNGDRSASFTTFDGKCRAVTTYTFERDIPPDEAA